MQISEVRIKLMDKSEDRLQAFCSVTFDNCFVVRDLKIIEGTSGPFVAMPSRKLTAHCHDCGAKNHMRASYCNHCGARLKEERSPRDPEGRAKLYADIAHPINAACREMIQNRVIAEYQGERERSHLPGYVSRYEDDYSYDAGEDYGDAPSCPPAKPAEATRFDCPAEPRPPHRLLTESGECETPPPQAKAPPVRREFGAGIFDDL